MCNIALHNIIFLCKTFWQQCEGRNNKCSLYCLMSKFWYESLKHLCLHFLKILLKTKALTEVLVSHGSQTRVPCLLKNFMHTVRIKSSNENYIYKSVSQKKEVPATVTVYQSGDLTLMTIFPLMVWGEIPAVQTTGWAWFVFLKEWSKGRMILNAHRLWITLSCKPMLYEKSQSLIILACIVCVNGITCKKKYSHL